MDILFRAPLSTSFMAKTIFFENLFRVPLKTSEIRQIQKEPSETRHREGAWLELSD